MEYDTKSHCKHDTEYLSRGVSINMTNQMVLCVISLNFKGDKFSYPKIKFQQTNNHEKNINKNAK